MLILLLACLVRVARIRDSPSHNIDDTNQYNTSYAIKNRKKHSYDLKFSPDKYFDLYYYFIKKIKKIYSIKSMKMELRTGMNNSEAQTKRNYYSIPRLLAY